MTPFTASLLRSNLDASSCCDGGAFRRVEIAVHARRFDEQRGHREVHVIGRTGIAAGALRPARKSTSRSSMVRLVTSVRAAPLSRAGRADNLDVLMSLAHELTE